MSDDKLLDNLACASQERRFLDDGDLRELVQLNIINPLREEATRLRNTIDELIAGAEQTQELDKILKHEKWDKLWIFKFSEGTWHVLEQDEGLLRFISRDHLSILDAAKAALNTQLS